jgi:hypothetical protein
MTILKYPFFWLLMVCLYLVNAPCQTKQYAHSAELAFHIAPIQSEFDLNSDVILQFTLKNISTHKVLATHAASLHDIVYLDVIKGSSRVGWKGRISNRAYPSGFFVALQPGESVSFKAAIFSSDGMGYQIKKPGRYRVRAEFSLSPKKFFAAVSQGAAIPERPVRSNWTEFLVRERAGPG